jgi:hypothetical protein
MLLLVAAIVVVSSASAASLAISGSVTQYLNLSVTNSPITVTFAGDGTIGTVDRSATLNIKANKVLWTVSFSSANSGFLRSTTAGINIPYYLQATGSGVVGATMTNALASAVQVTSAKTIAATALGKTPVNGVNYTLIVTVAAQAGTDTLWQAATDYTDTLTISISTP